MKYINLLLFITRSTWLLKIFSIICGGIFFTHAIISKSNDFFVKINEISKIPSEFLFLIIFLLLLIVIFILSQIPKFISWGANKVITELLIKIIVNFIISFVTVKASLITSNITHLTPNLDGKLLNFPVFSNNIELYKNFSIVEKKEWLKEIIEKMDLSDKHININNIPWDSISNKNEFLLYILTHLTEKKNLLETQIASNQKPFINSLMKILDFIIDHPYLIMGIVASSSLLIYFYYNSIIFYLMQLADYIKQLIKTSAKHAELTETLNANQQVIADQVDFLLKELQNMPNNDAQMKTLTNMAFRLKEVVSNMDSLSNLGVEHASKIQNLENSIEIILNIITRTKESDIDPTSLI